MSAIPLTDASFAAAIRSKAVELGRDASAEAVAAIEAACQSLATADPDTNAVTIDLGKGAIPISDYLASEVSGLPASASQATAPTPPGTRWSPRDRNDGFAAMSRGWAAQQNAKVAAEAATWPNPWMKGSDFNRTRQAVIQNVNPALAATMKKKAGVA